MNLDLGPGLRSRTLTVAALLTGSMVNGGWLIVRGSREGTVTPAEGARLFDQVLTHIERFYVDTIADSALYQAKAEGRNTFATRNIA